MRTLYFKSMIIFIISILIINGCHNNSDTLNSSEIVSDLHGEIYSFDIENGKKTNLTRNEAFDVAPVWSPNNFNIAFISDRDPEFPFIFLMNNYGGNQRRLTKIHSSLQFSWSHDGSMIANSSDGGEQFSNIYIIDIHDLYQKKLTDTSFNCINPKWSPDGSKILFSGSGQLFIINANGTELKSLVNDSQRRSSPIWSPDGSRILFIANTNNIYIIDSDGTNERKLTNSQFNYSPRWSPDGSKIVYASGPWLFDSNVFIMDADGANKQQLTYNEEHVSSPTWSPNGKSILYISQPNAPQDIIKIIDINGMTKQNIFETTEATIVGASWSKNGRKVLYHLQ